MTLHISIVSDVICPWCYLGSRRLGRALDELELRAGTAIEWLPFELNPDMPEEGVPRQTYRERKFGLERSRLLDRQMTDHGAAEGIAFAFERMSRTPNTRRAHMLIAEASRRGQAGALVEVLFRAYFEDGRDIGDADVLVEIAETAGIAPDIARTAISDEETRREVVSSETDAIEMRISGVPFFIVDRQWAVSGAQPTETWLAALTERRTQRA